jgi:RsiW-degrading membrane proteinase PrsW (M82 family)
MALAAIVALVPAGLWCWFFLREHAQRRSLVCLMFLAGMLSTAPILFYDALVRSGAELQFFFFRIVPENFNRTSSVFVSGSLMGLSGIRSTLLASFISFLLVGLIEEMSKFWVMRRSGKAFFRSIDDALQLGIIVAIGFAFAENVLNPTYFIGFVREFLLQDSPDWAGFLGNVIGRAILTNMVHIVSTGVLGYFFGLALFAGPYLEEEHRKGKIHWIAHLFHELFGYPEKAVFQRQMILLGIVTSVSLHGLFNFLVTFPEILPSHPRTLADLFGAPGGVLSAVPLLLIPSLFYVVGGFWLLTALFERKESMRERGHLVMVDTFVRD